MTIKPDGSLRWVTTFGLGHLRPFPGTWGSLPPLALGLLVVAALPDAAAWTVLRFVMLPVVVVFTLACVLLGDRAEARFGRKDPSQVVADETAGMALCFVLMPQVTGAWSAAASLVMAFVFFRALDIVKPWPAANLQAVPGGWGVVLDDLVAGVQAALLLWIAFWIATL
ncbi:MAG: phosphatidylglycerophosphatase A [Phycisphaeraceae bacterium]|nr:phosphatidylglycerophosphatase A [Phycisphaeraceae bacterium]